MPDLSDNTRGIASGLMFFLATCCGLIVANLYYSQPLVGPISASLGMSPEASGLIVTLTQIGYVVGLLLVVPLADRLENRALISAMVLLLALALVGTAFSESALEFLLCSLIIGIGAVAVQIIVPLAAHLASPERRGQVVGNVMGGLMFGIMLARPISSFVADLSSWRWMFFISAALMVLLVLVMHRLIPRRIPTASMGYLALLRSMATLAAHTPILQRRALYQAMMFGAFSLFWTTTPLLLAGPDFDMSQSGIALFALAGVAGVVSAPVAGRLADRGLTRVATISAMLCVMVAFAMTHIVAPGSALSLLLLVAAAVLLDLGVSGNVVLGQRAIYALGEAERSRLNAIYMATFFVGGAVGSAAGAWAYVSGGWLVASLLGGAMPLLALIVLLVFDPDKPCQTEVQTQ
ncbi:MFS transporter [Pseudomonas aestusnigri]|uniref:MFS transporter n=1 Tax=Halopseudomonas aestusnigri TaxID=857252 RepID=UPI001D1924F4|nr:MFS transporter [Halopseudomonas aestusnigri]MCC4259106.1 MFS transporter [Halopseudomonas aestusnigri]